MKQSTLKYNQVLTNAAYNRPATGRIFENEFGARFVSLSELMKNSNFVSVHILLNPVTRHLIGKKELSMMKKITYLINTSRGPIIDEKALVQVLKKRKMQGAAVGRA